MRVYFRVERRALSGKPSNRWVRDGFTRYGELEEAQEWVNEQDRPGVEYRIVKVTEEVVQ